MLCGDHNLCFNRKCTHNHPWTRNLWYLFMYCVRHWCTWQHVHYLKHLQLGHCMNCPVKKSHHHVHIPSWYAYCSHCCSITISQTNLVLWPLCEKIYRNLTATQSRGHMLLLECYVTYWPTSYIASNQPIAWFISRQDLSWESTCQTLARNSRMPLDER